MVYQKLGFRIAGDLAYFNGCVAIVENQFSRDGDNIGSAGDCGWHFDLTQPITRFENLGAEDRLNGQWAFSRGA